MTPEQRITKLEQELAELKRVIQVTPTRVNIARSLTVQGLVNGDRIYTKRTGSHVELTT